MADMRCPQPPEVRIQWLVVSFGTDQVVGPEFRNWSPLNTPRVRGHRESSDPPGPADCPDLAAEWNMTQVPSHESIRQTLRAVDQSAVGSDLLSTLTQSGSAANVVFMTKFSDTFAVIGTSCRSTGVAFGSAVSTI